MKNKIVLVTVIGGVGLLCILLIGPLWLRQLNDEPVSELTASIYQPAPTPGSDLDAIEADAGIAIPPSAREIHAVISGFRELDTWVRFDLPARDLPSFLENTHCWDPLVPTNPSRHSPGDLDPDWWQPNQSSDLVQCTGGHDFLRQLILVDRSDSQMFIVYVFSVTDNFTTPTPGPE